MHVWVSHVRHRYSVRGYSYKCVVFVVLEFLCFCIFNL